MLYREMQTKTTTRYNLIPVRKPIIKEREKERQRGRSQEGDRERESARRGGGYRSVDKYVEKLEYLYTAGENEK